MQSAPSGSTRIDEGLCLRLALGHGMTDVSVVGGLTYVGACQILTFLYG